jgi:hypothetical protein
MRTTSMALVVSLVTPLLAQGNAVPGTDIRAYNIGDVGYFGRRGAAHPNGEVGFGIGHSFCNTGTVNVPWVSTSGGVMADTIPKIAYLLARESGGRMVQVSGRSFMKHSRTPFNFSSGPCAPCNNTGGAFMFVGCSDTYGSGTNANRNILGPTTEIDPWLGTWNSIGSYFDRGDPAVGGAAATDGVQSLSSSQTAAFDPVKNRVEVRESDLVGGGTFHAQIHMSIVGEPIGNRGNNLCSRPCTITWNGSTWSSTVTGSQSYNGSVLTRWGGASTGIGQNGMDDGRFLVAVKVTGPVAGVWHYEYAVHNLDNSRGAAALRIPMPAAATVTNPGFRDIDSDALNEWSYSRAGNEIAFTAAANNALEWNTIYNVWFDSTQAPPLGPVSIDQARIGPGALTVVVDPIVPGGFSDASATALGTGCGGCRSAAYEYFSSSTNFDLANSTVSLVWNGSNYTAIGNATTWVTPAGTPLALTDDNEVTVALPFTLPYPGGSTTQLRVCSNGFVSPAASNGTGFTPSSVAFLNGAPRWAAAWHDFNAALNGGQVLLDSSPSGVTITWLNVANFGGSGSSTFQYVFLPSGDVHMAWQAMATSGNAYLAGWSPGAVSPDPGPLDLSSALATPLNLCASSVTTIALAASARPVLGTTIQLQTNGIPAGSPLAALVLSLARATPPIDLTSLGMAGCYQHVVGGGTHLYVAPGGSAATPLVLPLTMAFAGVEITGQSFAFDAAANVLGVVSSNGLLLGLGPQ